LNTEAERFPFGTRSAELKLEPVHLAKLDVSERRCGTGFLRSTRTKIFEILLVAIPLTLRNMLGRKLCCPVARLALKVLERIDEILLDLPCSAIATRLR